MRFDLISDVHEDMGWAGRPLKTGESDTLVLAGDVGNRVAATTAAVAALAGKYRDVVFVDGNHEFYSSSGDFDGTRDRLAAAFPKNVRYLDREGPFRCGNTAFVGANGWYHFRAPGGGSFRAQSGWWAGSSNDARRVFPGGDPHQVIGRWEESKATLFRQLEDVRDDPALEHVVVATHSVPHPGGLVEGYSPASNGAYYNGLFAAAKDADGGLLDKVRVWCFGHTHHPAFFADRSLGSEIWFVANPRGYGHEHHNSRRNRTVEVDVEDPGY